MMPMTRRIALTLAMSVAGSAGAAEYPVKPIRMLVAFAPGGGTDIIGRIAAQGITENLGQHVVVDNRPGAGGNIGTEMVAKATR